MFKLFLKSVYDFLLDERGEVPTQDDLSAPGPISDDMVVPNQDLGDTDPKPKDEDELPPVPEPEPDPEPAPADPDPDPDPVPDDAEEHPAPKYEGFGDNPTVDEVYSKFKEVMSNFDDFKGRAGATERNLANIRKSLKSLGLTTLKDEEGNYVLSPLEDSGKAGAVEQKLPKKFSEEDRQSLYSFFDTEDQAGQFIGSISKMIEDVFHQNYSEMEKQRIARDNFYQDYYNKRKDNASRIRKVFPMAAAKLEDGTDNPQFDKVLHEKATEIYEREYVKDGKEIDPYGQWRAVCEAAAMLKVSPVAVTTAVKKAVVKAKEEKKILGPVGGNVESDNSGKLTKDQYLALPLDKREEYDKRQSGIS